jgi:hypothetical protein
LFNSGIFLPEYGKVSKIRIVESIIEEINLSALIGLLSEIKSWIARSESRAGSVQITLIF